MTSPEPIGADAEPAPPRRKRPRRAYSPGTGRAIGLDRVDPPSPRRSSRVDEHAGAESAGAGMGADADDDRARENWLLEQRPPHYE